MKNSLSRTGYRNYWKNEELEIPRIRPAWQICKGSMGFLVGLSTSLGMTVVVILTTVEGWRISYQVMHPYGTMSFWKALPWRISWEMNVILNGTQWSEESQTNSTRFLIFIRNDSTMSCWAVAKHLPPKRFCKRSLTFVRDANNIPHQVYVIFNGT